MVVGLSPDSSNATVYEEYLHVENAEARGWTKPASGPDAWREEIIVEYQVLEKATDLDMSSAEFDRISKVRYNQYITKLENWYNTNW